MPRIKTVPGIFEKAERKMPGHQEKPEHHIEIARLICFTVFPLLPFFKLQTIFQ